MKYTKKQIYDKTKEKLTSIMDKINNNLTDRKNISEEIFNIRKYNDRIIKKHAVNDFRIAYVLEALEQSINELENNKEKAKEIFLELKIETLYDYKEPELENSFLKDIKKLTSAKRISEILPALQNLEMPMEEWHKRQLLTLLQDLKTNEKMIHDIFKNNLVKQYRSAVLVLATYVELLLAAGISYKLGKEIKYSNPKIADYLSKHIEKSQNNRILMAKEIGLIDKKLQKKLINFNNIRNEYIHKMHMENNCFYPIRLYTDGKKIIEELINLIIKNLPKYIIQKKCSMEKLIQILEKDFKKQNEELIIKIYNDLNKKNC